MAHMRKSANVCTGVTTWRGTQQALQERADAHQLPHIHAMQRDLHEAATNAHPHCAMLLTTCEPDDAPQSSGSLDSRKRKLLLCGLQV